MKELLTRCGYRCDLCLAFRDNIATEDRRALLSDGWHKCFGFRIPADQIACDGCLSAEPAHLIDTGCPVRPCVLEKGLANCSECGEYPCDRFRQREVVFDKLQTAQTISEAERELFVRPYENRARLDEIRAARGAQ